MIRSTLLDSTRHRHHHPYGLPISIPVLYRSFYTFSRIDDTVPGLYLYISLVKRYKRILPIKIFAINSISHIPRWTNSLLISIFTIHQRQRYFPPTASKSSVNRNYRRALLRLHNTFLCTVHSGLLSPNCIPGAGEGVSHGRLKGNFAPFPQLYSSAAAH